MKIPRNGQIQALSRNQRKWLNYINWHHQTTPHRKQNEHARRNCIKNNSFHFQKTNFVFKNESGIKLLRKSYNQRKQQKTGTITQAKSRTTNRNNTYSRLSLSRIPRDSLKHFEISVPRHTRVAEVRKTINRTTTFNKWICNLTIKGRNIYKIM